MNPSEFVTVYPRQICPPPKGYHGNCNIVIPRKIIPKSKLLDAINKSNTNYFYINRSKNDMNVTIDYLSGYVYDTSKVDVINDILDKDFKIYKGVRTKIKENKDKKTRKEKEEDEVDEADEADEENEATEKNEENEKEYEDNKDTKIYKNIDDIAKDIWSELKEICEFRIHNTEMLFVSNKSPKREYFKKLFGSDITRINMVVNIDTLINTNEGRSIATKYNNIIRDHCTSIGALIKRAILNNYPFMMHNNENPYAHGLVVFDMLINDLPKLNMLINYVHYEGPCQGQKQQRQRQCTFILS